MPDEGAGREPVPVVPSPLVRECERTEEQRGVGHSPGDHDVGTLRECVGDRTRAEIRGCEQRRCRQRVEGRAGVEVGEGFATRVEIVEPGQEIVAQHGRDRDPRDPERPRGFDRGARRGGRVDATGVGDDLGATVGDVRQRAREIGRQIARVAARLVALTIFLQDRERQLGERLEAQEVDAFRQAARRRRPVYRRRSPDRRRRDGAPGHGARRGSAGGVRPTVGPLPLARRAERGGLPGRARRRAARRRAGRRRSTRSATTPRVGR